MSLPLGPGPIDPPLRPPVAGAADLCGSIGSAIERAMIEGQKTHESLAARMGISRGYLSLIISGKRKASVTHVLRAVHATGSLVPIQWVCKEIGGELDWDELQAEEQAAKRRLEEVQAQRRREQQHQRRRAA